MSSKDALLELSEIMERSDGELSRHSKEREHRRAETSTRQPAFSSALEVVVGKISEGEETKKS